MADEEQPRPYARLSVNLAQSTADYLKVTSHELDINVTELVRRCIKLHGILREATADGASLVLVSESEHGEVRQQLLILE